MNPSIRRPFAYQSVHLSFSLSMRPSFRLAICPSCPSVYHQSVHLSMRPSVFPSTHLSFRPSVVHPLVHLYGLPPTHSSAILSICPAVCPSVRPFPPPLRPSDHLFVLTLLSTFTLRPSPSPFCYPVGLSIRPFVGLSSACPSFVPFVRQSIHVSLHLSVRLSATPSIIPRPFFLLPFLRQTTGTSFRSCVSPFFHPSVHPFVRPSTLCQYIRLSVCLSV